ncbi:MAG TPA: hypothetical protein VGC41_15105 [Kofleriaceae bacterium]
MGVGTRWIFPRALAGTDGAKLDELTASEDLPEFSEAELAELRELLAARQFRAKKQRKTAWSGELFKHRTFEVIAELVPTRLMIDSAKKPDDLITGAEVAHDIAARPAFALYDLWDETWTPRTPEQAPRMATLKASVAKRKLKAKPTKAKPTTKPKPKPKKRR